MDLSSRDVAVLFWGTIALGVALSNGPIRESIREILITAVERQAIAFFTFLALWTGASVFALQVAGIWRPEHSKDTVVWFALVAVPMGVNALASFESPEYLKAATDALKLTAVVEFLVAFAPFPLAGELVLVPALGVLAVVSGITSSREELARLHGVTHGLLGIVGLVMLGAAVTQVWSAVGSGGGASILRSFLVPPALSALLIPALLVLVLQARFDWLFAKIRGRWTYRTYARIRLILKLGLRPSSVLDFGRRYALDLPHVRTSRDLEKMLRNPPRRSVGRSSTAQK